MNNKTYSVIPMNKQDESWAASNGPEYLWSWIKIVQDDPSGMGVTMVGPYLTSEIPTVIYKMQHPKPTLMHRIKSYFTR